MLVLGRSPQTAARLLHRQHRELSSPESPSFGRDRKARGHALAMTEWMHEYVVLERERAIGRTSELLAEVRAGRLVRASRGVYRWAAARTNDPDRRADDEYVARIRGASLRASGPFIVAGMSAAALWQLPVLGNWPESVMVSSPRAAGGRSNAHLSRSYVGYRPPTQLVDGLTVTTLARTVADVARCETMERAVAVADAALRGRRAEPGARARKPITKAAIHRELDSLGAAPGIARARGVIAFADGASGSAGESGSRVTIRRCGLPAPVLQQRFEDAEGLIGFTDFWWPGAGTVGEFDGRGKYLREEFANGRTVAQIVVDEKVREDRLRALGLKVVRWGWRDALDARALGAKLRGMS